MSSPKIISVRSVLLSAPYADTRDDLEVILHLPSGCRTTGLVEIILDNGMIGLGEGYLAVFAPRVFEEIVKLVTPVLLGRDPQDITQLCRKVRTVTGYWSLQGAAQHVVSAIEIALQDCRAQTLGLPVWRLLANSERPPSLRLYASGGDAVGPGPMERELDRIHALGINVVKIRARNHQADKTRWCLRCASARGIAVAVDMTQNLAIPSQSVDDVVRFLGDVICDGVAPVFLEEALGPLEIANYAKLRSRTPEIKIAGGEIVTTSTELCQRIEQGCYDIAQPDATVLGGLGPTMEVFAAAQQCQIEVYVHCWGGPVGMMANYHAALAGGGTVAEWPIKAYPLREAMVVQPWRIVRGEVILPDVPGLGVRLTPEIERQYAFREDAVYHCLVDATKIPPVEWR